MRRAGSLWVAPVILALVSLLVAYLFERHVVGPLMSEQPPGDRTGAIWLQSVGWLVVAAVGLAVAWATLVRARRDLASAILVTVIGLGSWAILPLSYTAGVGDLIPNGLLHIVVGDVGYFQAAAAWVLAVGLVGIPVVVSRGRRRGA